ncbi:DUF4118 domain-containing protein [Bradyrhizobium sp. NP1]|uniref:DUF4118 domain-containing protein n=1 Tax=Bradyrhizobium sp. NP1 TaxID=3049772 RepID=UPI0025A5643D|nr:DUF4118 domain-containing protein [Bradyrhizobium sp. NP1]WJR78210.1 DUF4118 domain-containing protein [Bradyrhizobium sp. NP1]
MGKRSSASDYILRLRPWSVPSLLLVLLALSIAVALRLLLDYLGTTVYFATFLPAVLLAALLAGVPAGIFSAFASVAIVWWAFLPPIFEFSPLTETDSQSIVSFSLFSGLLIGFAHIAREALTLRLGMKNTRA